MPGAATVDVHQVAEGMERVERDADREDDRSPRDPGCADRRQGAVPRGDPEVGVLEPAEECDVDDDAEREPAPGESRVATIVRAFEPEADDEVRGNRTDQGKDDRAGSP